MNRLLARTLLALLPVAFAGNVVCAEPETYELSRVEQKPVPRFILFKLWHDVALKECAQAQKRHNLTPDECRAKVNERHAACEASAAGGAPETIDSKVVSKRLGRAYLQCVTPYYFCKGVEVHNEQEAREHCP